MDQLNRNSQFQPVSNSSSFQAAPGELVPPTRPNPDCRTEAEANKSSDVESRIEKSDDSNDTTDLELKTPGSTSEQARMEHLEDIFESTLNLEESHLKEGYDEGYADGLISGKEEGQQVGLKTGFETGEELGFYRGCVDVWSSAIRVDPNFILPRTQKTIKQMDELLQNYPMLEPANESVSDMMDSLRLKFRVVCASLNLKLEYNGYPKASDAGNIEF